MRKENIGKKQEKDVGGKDVHQGECAVISFLLLSALPFSDEGLKDKVSGASKGSGTEDLKIAMAENLEELVGILAVSDDSQGIGGGGEEEAHSRHGGCRKETTEDMFVAVGDKDQEVVLVRDTALGRGIDNSVN